MEFSPKNIGGSGFQSLSRGTSVIGDREIKPDALIQFKKVANANPEADRLIMSEDGLDVVEAPKPFFGIPIEIIFGKSEKETIQNKAILARFQEALIKCYGTRVTDFAFPDLNQRLLHASKLDAKTIERVLQDAALFEELFSNGDLDEKMILAVSTDIDAMASCVEFEKTSEEYNQLYEEAQSAIKNKERAAEAITDYIKKKMGLSDLLPNDPKLQELQELQTLWRAAALETPENPEEDLKIFEQAANTSDPLKRDRVVLNRERTRLTAAPRPVQGWTGAAVQWVAGRDKNSVEENRRTVEGFRRALSRKYGHTITSFAFSTSQSRYETGSRLNSETIQKTLAKAKQVSDLLCDADLKGLMDTWTSSVKKAETAEIAYRNIKLTREALSREKDQKLSAAESSYKTADDDILDYLTKHAIEKNITVAQSARLRHLWFDEARARYKRAQLETRPSAPSAPLIQRPQRDSVGGGINPHYRGEEENGSILGHLGSTLGVAAKQVADYLQINDQPNAIPMATDVRLVNEGDHIK